MNKFQYSLSVIIPIYNEEKILSEIIEKLFYSLNEILNDFEILIIENGSIDKSYELSKKLASEFTEIKAVHLEEANYGNALREGIKLSSKKYTVNFSIDFIDLVFLNNALEISENYDLIIGSKRIGDGDKRPLFRKIGTLAYNFILSFFINMPFKDTHGLKLYNTAVAQKYEKQTISSSSIFDEELIYRVYKSGHNIKEIGVSVHEIRPARTGILSRAFEVIINLYNLKKNLNK
ncbi:MAG: hypothetical protein CL730_00845 [Chloroflexi bacterium]|nr:hypothetical protein [Chloroflexota bacterium]MBO98806.1 hypothetical protein [Chloroflexota bacterium]|tara:strand:- start:5471 stop:6172 length:702 start_codon:yes stop_codon:yes gene_type:complete